MMVAVSAWGRKKGRTNSLCKRGVQHFHYIRQHGFRRKGLGWLGAHLRFQQFFRNPAFGGNIEAGPHLLLPGG